MKLHKLVLVALLVSGGFAGTYSTAFAQGAHDDGSGPETRLISPQIAAGQVRRYVATYMASRTAPSPRSATVVSIKRLVYDVRDLGGLEGWVWRCCLHDQLDPWAGTDW